MVLKGSTQLNDSDVNKEWIWCEMTETTEWRLFWLQLLFYIQFLAQVGRFFCSEKVEARREAEQGFRSNQSGSLLIPLGLR